jgi:hypothetical protein
MKVAPKGVVPNVLTKISTVAMQNRLVRDADGVVILTAPKGAETYAEGNHARKRTLNRTQAFHLTSTGSGMLTGTASNDTTVTT